MKISPVCAFILAIALTAGCSRQSETPLDDAIIDYAGGSSSTEKMARGLLEETSTVSFKRDDLSSNDSCLFYRDDEKFRIVDIKTGNHVLDVPSGTISFCAAGSCIAASGGIDIRIYQSDGDSSREILVDDPKDRIKALAVSRGRIYYYKGHQIFSQDLKEGPPLLVTKEKFSPPNKKYYQSYLMPSGRVLGVITGSAGNYLISAVDVNTGRVMVSNISASSSRASFTGDAVYYVSGGAGDWKLYRFGFAGKSKKEIRKFRDISSIEITPQGFIFSDSEGTWAQDYSGAAVRIPFEYRIAGKLGDTVLISFSGSTYAVNVETMINKLDQLRIKVPEIFN